MKIGIDARSLEGNRTGVGRYLVNLLYQWQNTKSKNIRFVLYFKHEIPADLKLPERLFQKKLLKKPFNISSHALFLHLSLPKQARQDKVDVLFCPAYVAPLFSGLPIALTLHDIIYEAHPEMYNWPSRADRFLLKFISEISAKKAKLILTPSEFSKQEIIRYYKVSPEKIKVTPLAVDKSFCPINNSQKLEKVKSKYGIENKFIFFVGAIFNRRHLDKTIEAFRKIAEDFSEYQFLIAGANYTSPYVDIDGLIEVANHRLKRKAVLRTNHLKSDDLIALYNSAEALIWLSDYEGFGLPVLEAMACGTPVVTSSVASLPEVVDNGAVYVKNNQESEEIAKALHKVLSNQSLREKLIRKNIEQVKNFSWKRCAQDTLKALKNVRC